MFGSFSAYNWSYFPCIWAFPLTIGVFLLTVEVHLISTSMDRKQTSSTVSKKARGVSKQASPLRVVADVWEKDGRDFQAKPGSSGSCRLPVLLFLGLFVNTKENLKNTKDFYHLTNP